MFFDRQAPNALDGISGEAPLREVSDETLNVALNPMPILCQRFQLATRLARPLNFTFHQ